MQTIAWLILGLLLAAGYILLIRRHEPQTERMLTALGLLVAAIVYVGFAIVWGDRTWLLTEILGVFCYGTIAWLGIRYSALWLAVGWCAHPLWDALLHLPGPGTGIAPTWYVIACISFDVLVGLYACSRISIWAGFDNTRSVSP